jgi:hypothetical protein
MFLAQAAHECGAFAIVEENGNYSAKRLLEIFPVTYPGTAYRRFTPGQARAYAHKPKAILSRAYARKDLGNGSEASGDGWRYRGRGPGRRPREISKGARKRERRQRHRAILDVHCRAASRCGDNCGSRWVGSRRQVAARWFFGKKSGGKPVSLHPCLPADRPCSSFRRFVAKRVSRTIVGNPACDTSSLY